MSHPIPSPSNTPSGGEEPGAVVHVEKAGAFDIRNFIGTLIGLYGVILTVWGLVRYTAAESVKTGGVNANLWTGLVMIVVAAIFVLWARLRPIRIRVVETGGADGHPELKPL